jgi:hypothetical protein
MDLTPTRDDRFSFGLWTVGWQARLPARPAGAGLRAPAAAAPGARAHRAGRPHPDGNPARPRHRGQHGRRPRGRGPPRGRDRPGRTASSWFPTSRASAPPTPPRHRSPVWSAAGHHHPGQPGPSRGRGHAVRPGRRSGRPPPPGRGRGPGPADRRWGQAVAPSLFDAPVLVPPGEYVADGAARQAAWLLSGDPEPPSGGRPCPHEPSKHHQHPTSTRPTPPPATSAPEPNAAA